MSQISNAYLNRLAALSTLGALTIASSTLVAQTRPQIRQVSAPVATSTDSHELYGAVVNTRALSDGKLLINDVSNRRVLLVDSTFKVLKIVADSASGAANSYGSQTGSLIQFQGDSTLFIDASSSSMLVIDANGNIARVMAVPRSQDAIMLATGGITNSVFYSNGYLIYRGMPSLTSMMSSMRGNTPQLPTLPDTMAIIRVNLKTRGVDTLGFVKTPQTKTNISRGDDGSVSISIQVNPLPTIDEWTVTSNGDAAFLRGKDYHVDFVSPDLKTRSTAKVPFDWKRLTDEDKSKFIDSVKTLRERLAAADSGQQGKQMAQAFGSILGGGASTAAAAAPVMVVRGSSASAAGSSGPVQAPKISAPTVEFVPASELPDYQPPFFAVSTRADADGNIWVRTIPTKPEPAGTIYDVINSNGEAVDRVLIPVGRTLVGFGPGGVVYLGVLNGTNTTLEKVIRQK